MDWTTLTRNLGPLQERRLVKVDTDRTDTRAREVTLTVKGQQQLAAALPLWEGAQRAIVEGLGQEMWPQLQDALARTVAVAAEVTE